MDVGRAGEEAAAAAYRRAGYRVLSQNWRSSIGEIDLVVARGPLVVFCEVKTRRGSAFGGPHEAVTWRKQLKLRRLAEAFLASPALASVDGGATDVRFDVASVTIGPDGKTSVHLFERAF